jgi:hypothetical protein
MISSGLLQRFDPDQSNGDATTRSPLLLERPFGTQYISCARIVLPFRALESERSNRRPRRM